MSKPIEEILTPKPEVRPRVYAYSINDQAHKGLLKVGQTTRNVKQRVAEQLKTATIKNYKIELDESAERDDGAIFYNHKWRVQGGLLQDRSDIVDGFPVRQIIIWQRDGGFNFNPGYFLPTYEVIYLICKPGFKLVPKANGVGDVWRIPQENNNPHPAPFPIELAQRCIAATNAQVILDPFMGSGTTAMAAESCGREWVGMELSGDYCKLAKERILAAKGLFRNDPATRARSTSH